MTEPFHAAVRITGPHEDIAEIAAESTAETVWNSPSEFCRLTTRGLPTLSYFIKAQKRQPHDVFAAIAARFPKTSIGIILVNSLDDSAAPFAVVAKWTNGGCSHEKRIDPLANRSPGDIGEYFWLRGTVSRIRQLLAPADLGCAPKLDAAREAAYERQIFAHIRETFTPPVAQ